MYCEHVTSCKDKYIDKADCKNIILLNMFYVRKDAISLMIDSLHLHNHQGITKTFSITFLGQKNLKLEKGFRNTNRPSCVYNASSYSQLPGNQITNICMPSKFLTN